MYKFFLLVLFFVALLSGYAGNDQSSLLEKAREWLVFPDSSPAQETQTSSSSTRIQKMKKTLGEKRREIFKALKRLLLQSDPLGKDKDRGFRPIHLRLVKLNSYKTRLSNTVSYVWKMKDQSTRSLSATYSPLIQKNPFAQMKMDAWDLSLGLRKYYRNHVFFQGNLGYRIYRPNEFYVNYFQNQGFPFADRSMAYATVGLGVRILKRVPIMKTPLVLRTSYTFGNNLRFPIPGPHGYDQIGIRGFKVGISVRLRL